VIPAGAHVDDQDPIVVSNPQFFERIAGIEQATAAPGEVRAVAHPEPVKVPAKKAPAKKAARART
jgi:hypothetical protein